MSFEIVKGIKVQEVKSSNVHKLGYSPENKVMEVHFRNGAIYQYHPVTETFYNELLKADSIGAHFNKHVKTNTSLEFNMLKPKTF